MARAGLGGGGGGGDGGAASRGRTGAGAGVGLEGTTKPTHSRPNTSTAQERPKVGAGVK